MSTYISSKCCMNGEVLLNITLNVILPHRINLYHLYRLSFYHGCHINTAIEIMEIWVQMVMQMVIKKKVNELV